MRATEFITEDESKPTYSFEVKGDWKDRVWVTMFETAAKDEQWLHGTEPYEVGEVTLDPDPKTNTVYFNRIDITKGKGQGKGSILLAEVLRLLSEKGFKSVTSYVNHNNPESRGMFKKFGFQFKESDEWDAQYGDYWAKTL